MSTHTYMYSSTDTNMEAHALDKHTSATPVVCRVKTVSQMKQNMRNIKHIKHIKHTKP